MSENVQPCGARRPGRPASVLHRLPCARPAGHAPDVHRDAVGAEWPVGAEVVAEVIPGPRAATEPPGTAASAAPCWVAVTGTPEAVAAVLRVLRRGFARVEAAAPRWTGPELGEIEVRAACFGEVAR